MRSRIGTEGVVLPKEWFAGSEEVEIHREKDRVVVVPLRPDDPISQLGESPLHADVHDASTNHDRYLYDR